MKDNKYYNIIRINEDEISEIDFDLYSEIFPEVTKEIEEEKGNGWYNSIGEYNNDAYPINIDRLIKHLQDIKKKGANYVSMNYHTDYIGYVIEGLSITQSTSEDVETFLKKEEEKNKKMEEYLKLKAQLNKLSKEL